MSVHAVFILSNVDVCKSLIDHKLALGFFAGAGGGALASSVAAAASPGCSGHVAGFLLPFHKLLVTKMCSY